MVKLLRVKVQNKGKSHQLRALGDDCIELEVVFLDSLNSYVFNTKLEGASVLVVPYLDKELSRRSSLPLVYSESFFNYLLKMNRLMGAIECLRSELDFLDRIKYLIRVVAGKKIVYKFKNYVIYNHITRTAIQSLGDQDSERFVSLLDTLDLWVD